MFPKKSTATQRDSVGQETPRRLKPPIGVVVHAPSPPVGSVDVITSPLFPSTPTHSDVEGHEIPWMAVPLSTFVTVHFEESPVGSAEATMSPEPSPATQSEAEAQANAVRLRVWTWSPKSNADGVQFNAAPDWPDAAGTAHKTPRAISPPRADKYKERRRVGASLCLRRRPINPAVCVSAACMP